MNTSLIHIVVHTTETGCRFYRGFSTTSSCEKYLKEEYELSDYQIDHIYRYGFYENSEGMFEIEECEFSK